MSALQTFVQRHAFTTPPTGPSVSATAGRRNVAKLFHALGYQRGAEIGVWAGEFSKEICVLNPGVSLLCVDPWQAYADYGDPKNDQRRMDIAMGQAMARLAPYGCDVKRMTSTAAADTVKDGSLDFVYVDSNHAKGYVLADLAAWTPKIRSGGIMSGHDFEIKKRHAHLEVREAVTEFAAIHKIAPIYVVTRDKVPSFFWVVP